MNISDATSSSQGISYREQTPSTSGSSLEEQTLNGRVTILKHIETDHSFLDVASRAARLTLCLLCASWSFYSFFSNPRDFSETSVIDATYLAIALFSTMLIIEGLFNIKNEIELHNLLKNNTKQNTLLFCRPTFDPLGVATTIPPRVLELLKEFSKTHSIAFKRMNSFKDVNTAIDFLTEQGRIIKILLVLAHGGPSRILLGEAIEGEKLRELHFSKLAADAAVVLISCSVGSSDAKPNVAEWTQLFAGPYRNVHAAHSAVHWNGTNCVNPDQGVKAQWSFASKGLDLLERIFGSGEDITAKISYDEALPKAIKHSLDRIANEPADNFGLVLFTLLCVTLYLAMYCKMAAEKL